MPEQTSRGNRGILAAVVVILLLAGGYFFFNKSQTKGVTEVTPGPTTEMTSGQQSETSDASPSAKPGEQLTVSLLEQNNSNQAGIATLTEMGDQVNVQIRLAGATASAEPAHLHTGKCPKPGAVKYPLSDVVNGLSETVLDVSLSTLKSSLPLALNVHKSKEEIQVYLACGDL